MKDKVTTTNPNYLDGEGYIIKDREPRQLS